MRAVEGLHDHMSLVSFKRAYENCRVLIFEFMLILFISSFSQSISKKYYLKFPMVILQGCAYCRSLKCSCENKLTHVGEQF